MNSIILKKKNLSCGHFDFNFSKGRCKRCANIENTKKRIKEHNVIRGTYENLSESVISRREKDNLQKYFEYHMEHSEKRCENCGANLSGLTEKEWRGCQHHVFEKSLFPSVRAELINHAVLGYYCCHGQFHSSYKNAMQMPIWNTLVERVQPILHLVKEKHKILELFKLDEVKK